jgi:hypothetical protein
MSQSIENVDFTTNEEFIKVTYNLTNGTEGKYYNINVVFEKKDGSTIEPVNLKGDYLKVSPGNGKEIYWNYMTEVDEYLGPLRVILTISDSSDFPIDNIPEKSIANPNSLPMSSFVRDSANYTVNTRRTPGGAGNMVLSMLLPGFGDHFVNEKDHFTPLLVTAAFAGSVYMAYTTMNAANLYYDNYLSTRSQSVMDENYKLAIDNKKQHEIYFGVASAIWLFDVIHVASKGSKNTKKYKHKTVKLLPMYNQYKKSNPFEFTLVKTF